MANLTGEKSIGIRTALLLITGFSLCSCAKPNYARESQSPPLTIENSTAIPTACMIQFSLSKLCVDWGWEIPPQNNVMASLIIKVFRKNSFDQTPILTDFESPAQMTLEMPSMSFCSSPRTVEKIDTGIYRIKNIYFAMPGEWQLRLTLLSLTALKDEAKILWSAN